MENSKEKESKVIKEEEIYRGKWIGMKHISYSIGDSTVNNYQSVFRTTSKAGQLDGVDIIPIIKYKERISEIVMIVEFRAPTKGFTLEFPTGMAEGKDY